MNGSRTPSKNDDRRTELRTIADATLEAIKRGSYDLNDTHYDLSLQISTEKARYYAPDSMLSAWSSVILARNASPTLRGEISIVEVSTLEGARSLAIQATPDGPSHAVSKVGVLNFASAKKPGGGFINGAQAQEESIARSSTLYPTLVTRTAKQFYDLHNRNPKGGYYSHAMIYSPSVTVFRDDSGAWIEPYQVNIITSPAVNAGVVRQGAIPGSEEAKIAQVMRERMARILFLFERQGVKDVVLGSFGTGVFRNSVEAVANIWVDLLVADNARFKNSFDHVVFAILGRETYDNFRRVFEARTGSA
ncbi:hypothetical protein EW146_g10380 [Bondarzewia mesenterica]|uniref:Microbial-type PARG catalytic domain-containing protein n=1 Tax=Bondarzewia mesenterica TaxID=1095465 RepID=A0A4S4KYT3_9AGAM|nr:hypothetical protein EW146_g10380 [Bondarzewia mesenterica]